MISKIGLKNFKAFAEATLPLKQLTLLSGVNGSGKSTILQSLAVLRQSFEAGCLVSDGGLLLNGEYVDLGVGKDVLCEFADSSQIKIEIADDKNSYEWIFAYTERDDLLQLKTSKEQKADLQDWFDRGFFFLKADRIVPAVVYPKSFNETVRRRTLGVRGQFTPHFLSAHQDEVVGAKRIRTDAVSSRLLDQVNVWLGDISPGVSVMSAEVGDADLTQLLFRYGGSAGIDSSNHYRPTNVGFGLTYVLPIIVSCLVARSGDLLLLENPEAHLHPFGQSAMGDLIARAANDGVQIVVESHSDHLLNGIRLAVKSKKIPAENVQLHFCMRKQGERDSAVVSPTINEDGRINKWPEGFFDQWEKALLELV